MRRTLPIALVVAAATALVGGRATADDGIPFFDRAGFRLDLVSFLEWQDYDENAANNPGNQVFRLEDRTEFLELRPEIALSKGAFSLDVSPRLRWTRERIRTEPGGSDRDVEWTPEIAYLTASYIFSEAQLTAGRYVNLWGPSLFLSPSNPFHPDSGQSAPYIELEARDYVELAYGLGPSWSSRVIYNFDEGDQDDTGIDTPIGVLTADYFGSTVAATALIQGGEDWWGVGGYGQWTPNDAVVIYGDGIVRRGPRSVPEVTAAGLAEGTDKDWSAKVLGGAAYSFEDGTTVSLEYLHNSAGYDDGEAERAFAFHDLGLDPAAPPAARASIGALAFVPFLDLRRNYLLARVSRTSLWDELDVTLLYSHNLDDGSGRLVGNADWYFNDTAKLFLNTTVFHGDERSEFGRFLDTQVTFGIRWSLY